MEGSPTTTQAASQRVLQRNGILITLGALIAIEVLARTVFRVPTPCAILLVPVAYAAFTGGLRTGLISAMLVFLYVLYFLEGSQSVIVLGGRRGRHGVDDREPEVAR